jgi:hypothetical protein
VIFVTCGHLDLRYKTKNGDIRFLVSLITITTNYNKYAKLCLAKVFSKIPLAAKADVPLEG